MSWRLVYCSKGLTTPPFLWDLRIVLENLRSNYRRRMLIVSLGNYDWLLFNTCNLLQPIIHHQSGPR